MRSEVQGIVGRGGKHQPSGAARQQGKSKFPHPGIIPCPPAYLPVSSFRRDIWRSGIATELHGASAAGRPCHSLVRGTPGLRSTSRAAGSTARLSVRKSIVSRQVGDLPDDVVPFLIFEDDVVHAHVTVRHGSLRQDQIIKN